MRSFDLTPLLRSAVGFDDLFGLTESLARFDQSAQSYPPYNIEKLGEDEYRITLAVAGFTPEELDIVVQDQALSISGRAAEADEDGRTYLHRGIAKRAFERTFRLAAGVQVTGASYADGLLTVELKREIPEHMKPRQIAIQSGKPGKTAKRIEKQAA